MASLGRVVARGDGKAIIEGLSRSGASPVTEEKLPSFAPEDHMYKPVFTLEDLERCLKEGHPCVQHHEDSAPLSDWDLARDLAALANSGGGTVLLGSRLAADAAADRERGSVQAARLLCEPPPLLATSHLADDSGEGPLAVNVWPLPGQPVGVRAPNQCFSYPMWQLGGIRELGPRDLPVLLSTALRETAVLLACIPVGARVTLIESGTGRPTDVPLTLSDVRPTENAAVLTHVGSTDGVCLPLTLVEHVWRDRDDWRIVAQGSLDRVIGGRFLPRALGSCVPFDAECIPTAAE